MSTARKAAEEHDGDSDEDSVLEEEPTQGEDRKSRSAAPAASRQARSGAWAASRGRGHGRGRGGGRGGRNTKRSVSPNFDDDHFEDDDDRAARDKVSCIIIVSIGGTGKTLGAGSFKLEKVPTIFDEVSEKYGDWVSIKDGMLINSMRDMNQKEDPMLWTQQLQAGIIEQLGEVYPPIGFKWSQYAGRGIVPPLSGHGVPRAHSHQNANAGGANGVPVVDQTWLVRASAFSLSALLLLCTAAWAPSDG